MIIDSFLQSNAKLIGTLADNWLDSQAASFAVWCGETQLACWPSDENGHAVDARAEIRVRGKGIGELRLAGLSGESVTNRLKLDAAFLAGIIEREQHSSNLASELIDTRDQLVALFNLNQNPWTSLELDQTLHYLVSETMKLTRAQAAFIWLKATTVHLACIPERWLEAASAEEYVRVLETQRKKHIFIDGENGSAASDTPNLLILPICLPGSNTALIGIRTTVDVFSLSPLIKLLNTIGEYAGTRIENLMMVHERMANVRLRTEMDLARNVQLSLLPATLPVVPGLEIWAATRPASLVGGDFYDFIEQPEGLLTISVGDISGKGLPASLPMAMVRSLIRSQTRIVPFLTPQKILYATNGEVIDDFTQMAMFATVFVSQYDALSNSFLFSNAGHSPVIYCPASGTARMLEADDIPLGMLPNILYANQRLPFQVGDVLLIGTDGLYEAHNRSDEIYGHENLIEQVSALAHLSAGDIANELFASVNDFREGEAQEDDQTLIVIKRVA